MIKNSENTITPLIGVSQAIKQIKNTIKDAADICLNVMITGETGTGKEVVAQNLYAQSDRDSNNFVKINCAAMPEPLLESELFGYEKGAFTGAEKNRPGKFISANNGVLFLDEIGDMPLILQSKMLHVLQSGEFSPLGTNEEIKTDVWVIAATNKNLENSIAHKLFREDLFYRLNIVNIHIPPLRERIVDIPFLIEYYCRQYKSEYQQPVICMPDSNMMTKLCNYSWPGNVRQLQNSVKKQLVYKSWEKVFNELLKDISCEAKVKNQDGRQENMANGFLDDDLLSSEYAQSQFSFLPVNTDKILNGDSLKDIKKRAVAKVEKQIIEYVLEQVGWNKKLAARKLKISYRALLYKIKDFKVVSLLPR